MNTYTIIILGTILAGFLLEVISDLLNLKNLNPELPDEIKEIYDEEQYRKSQDYTLRKTKFGFIESGFSLVLILLFWFLGGFPWLDNLVKSWSDFTIIRGLAFIGILVGANSILGLPFGIYSTFVIEEKFGFNKTTISTFILDILKSLGLTIIIGGPMLAAIIYILQETSSNAWLYGWGTVTVISLLLQFIAPTWIMPLFNKFKPLEDEQLKNAILSYTAKVKYPLKNLFVMDGSKRSSKSNAFFTGFGKNKRIALFDTLLEKHSINEIVAILAHEIGHYKKRHIQLGIFISIIHTGIIFFLLSLFLSVSGLYETFYISDKPLYAGLLFFGMLYSPIEMLLSIVMNFISRKNELQADKFAVESSGLKDDMLNALKKLSKDNLVNLTPHPLNVFLNYSHPPLLKRIESIKELL